MKRRFRFMVVLFTTMTFLFGIVGVASAEHFKKKGSEGCTPGYWKQTQHFGSWQGYTPGQEFDTVFEDAFEELTLLQVLQLRGGGLNALGRHTVAALLNAASSDVEYGPTTAEVIFDFNLHWEGTPEEIEALKDIFADFNELGCPLARNEAD